MAAVEVITLHSALGDRKPITQRVEWHGQTIRDVLHQVYRADWDDDAPIVCAHNAGVIPESEWDRPIAADGQYVFLAVPGFGPELVAIYGMIVFSVIINGLSGMLAPKPDPLGNSLSQLDQESPAAHWEQVLTMHQQGFAIPLVYGERDVGGTVIEAGAFEVGLFGFVNYFTLALGHGRFESILGVVPGARGEIDNYTGNIPNPLVIDGNSVVLGSGGQLFLRMGEDAQAPIPLAATATTDLLQGELNNKDEEVTGTISATVTMVGVSINMLAPGGSWQLDGQNNHQSLQVDLEGFWRPVGGASWTSGGVVNYFTQGWVITAATPLSYEFDFTGSPVTGPIDVRILRKTAVPTSATVSSQIQVVSLAYLNKVQHLAYPGIAHLALSGLSNDKMSVRRPNFRVRCKGRRVRVWDATINGGDPSEPNKSATHQGEYWEVPPAGDDYAGIWSYPPGQNPAWIAADILTSTDALGSHAHADDRIDWQSFRDLADRCDSHILTGGSNEALFQCDIVLDAPMEALRAVQHVLATARARLFARGNKLAVAYQFVDAHGRGTNSVPAKARKFLVTSGQVRDFRKHFVNTRRRPAVIDVQFADRDKGYVWDFEAVEDPDGGHNDPTTFEPLGFSKESQQLRGVTRRTQANREGLYMHKANRLLYSRVEFVCGPDQLAAEPGDVIGIEHVSMRPFDQESYGYRFSRAVAAATDVYLDHQVVLVPATTYQVVFRDEDGTILERQVTATDGTYVADSAISVSGAAFTVKRSAPIAIGQLDKVVEDFEVTRISLAQDMLRKVEAVRFDDTLEITADVGADVSSAQNGITGQLVQAQQFGTGQGTADQATDLSLDAGPHGHGAARIGWCRPAAQHDSPARVWVRAQTDAQAIYSLDRTQNEQWHNLGETPYAELHTDRLPSLERFDIAVCLQNLNGVWQDPDEAAQLLNVRVPEFPPNPPTAPRNLVATVQGKGILLRWSPINSEGVRYYEVRNGTCWISGHRIGTTTDRELYIENPPRGEFMVRARARNGLYSPILATAVPAAFTPDDLVEVVTADQSTFPGTKTNVTYNAGTGELSIDAGYLEGIWQTDQFDKGTSTDAIAILSFDTRYEYDPTIDEVVAEWGDFGIQSGEAHWWMIRGRDASPLYPGHNFDEDIADHTGLISDVGDDRGTLGYWGEVNQHVRHKIEVNYDSNGWEDYRPERRVHQVVEWRVTLNRRDQDRNLYLSGPDVGHYH